MASVFANAARAIFTEMAGEPLTGTERGPIRIEVSASTLEELLVRWLEELLFLSATRRIIFTKFDIAEISETRVEAEAWGVDFSEAPPELEIKAVTYHELKIEKTEKGYRARFVADI